MRRLVAILTVATGWSVLVVAVVVPLLGMMWALSDPRAVHTDVIDFPVWWRLLARSVALAVLAASGALLLGIGPAWWLGTCRRSARPFWLGMILIPLLIPPQVYAYAWSLSSAAGGVGTVWTSVIRAGLVSAGWLWPIPALILASGWRTIGREVMALALLDTSAGQAFWRAVLPALRHALICSGCVVFAVAMLEYPIPHFLLAPVYATELLVLWNINAPYGQIIRAATPPIVVVVATVGWAWWHFRGTRDWGRTSDENAIVIAPHRTRMGHLGVWGLRGLALASWGCSVGIPVVMLLRRFRRPGVWTEAFTTFANEWAVSVGVSLAAGVAACSIVVATIMAGRATASTAGRWMGGIGFAGAALTALLPPVVVGLGFVMIYNGFDFLRSYYTQTCVVWVYALTARYAAVAVVMIYLAWGRHAEEEVDQARVDGADLWAVLGEVLLPRMRGPLVAAGLLVALLAMFEVVISQLAGPIVYPSLAITLLNHMHYGQDDVVIATCLVIMVAGAFLVQVCGWLLETRYPD